MDQGALPAVGQRRPSVPYRLPARCACPARTPTGEPALSCTGCVRNHHQKMRWRAGRRPLEECVPRGQGLNHRGACLLQPRQLFVHFFQQTLAGSTDRMARRTTTVACLQEACELLRRKAESDRIADEEQPRDRFIGVVPETAGCSRGARQDTDALVVADQIRTDTGPTGRLADSEGVAGHAPSYNLESFQIQPRVAA
jgi:hypothetical protein